MIFDNKLPDGFILMNIFLYKKKIFYETFKELLKRSVEKEMKRINGDKIKGYNPICDILKLNETSGKCRPLTVRKYDRVVFEQISVILDEEVSRGFYEYGNDRAFMIIFHELRHVLQNIAIKIGLFTSDFLMMIKDSLIREYELKQFDTDNYYNDNYDDISLEIDAQRYSLINLIKFLGSFGYKIPDDILIELEKEFIHDIKEERKIIIDGKEEYKSMEDIFDFIVIEHPEYLDLYPQLRIEYIKDGKIVRRKTRDELIDTLLDSQNKEEKEYVKKLLRTDKYNLSSKKTQ